MSERINEKLYKEKIIIVKSTKIYLFIGGENESDDENNIK